jgi:predicted nucleic acid-binding protein
LTPSRLHSAHERLVLDASVLINILGTGRSDIILQVLNRIVMVDEIALREVTIDPFSGKSSGAVLSDLRQSGLIEVISMGNEAYEMFISLTGGDPPDDLDDGEAATLAQAAFGNYVAVIDERKAIRVSGIQFPELELLEFARFAYLTGVITTEWSRCDCRPGAPRPAQCPHEGSSQASAPGLSTCLETIVRESARASASISVDALGNYAEVVEGPINGT